MANGKRQGQRQLTAAEMAQADRIRAALGQIGARINAAEAMLDDRASRANNFLRQMPEMLLCALVERDDEKVAEIHARRDNADRALRDIECSGRLIDAYRKMAGKVGRDLGDYWGIPSDADFLSQWPSFLTHGLLGSSGTKRETKRAEPREGGVAIPVMLDGASPFPDGPAVSEMPSAIQFPSFGIKHYP